MKTIKESLPTVSVSVDEFFDEMKSSQDKIRISAFIGQSELDSPVKRLELKKGEDGKLSEARYGNMACYGTSLKEAVNSLKLTFGAGWPEDMKELDWQKAEDILAGKT